MDDINEVDIAKIVLRVFAGGIIIGLIILGWVTILGPAFNQADYNNFNSSPQHVQAIAQRFADDCQQIAETTDPTAKKAILFSNVTGNLTCLGRVKGFGVPYGTQESPPTNGTQPVPEPNGLYPSQNTSASGTTTTDFPSTCA